MSHFSITAHGSRAHETRTTGTRQSGLTALAFGHDGAAVVTDLYVCRETGADNVRIKLVKYTGQHKDHDMVVYDGPLRPDGVIPCATAVRTIREPVE